MGQVISIVDEKLVIIQSIIEHGHTCKPLNEETILFDSNRRELGKIFEVFGPVQAPFYSIRFNNVKEITDNCLNVETDSSIFYAHDSTEYTKFIFNLDELRRLKGSDASWNNDNEPPAECIDYSDDEQERSAKQELKQKRMKPGLGNQLQSYLLMGFGHHWQSIIIRLQSVDNRLLAVLVRLPGPIFLVLCMFNSCINKFLIITTDNLNISKFCYAF